MQESNSSPRPLPPISAFLPFSIILALVGWGGLIYLINNTLPTLGPRWFFFFFVTLAMAGTGLPVIVFLNIRFPGNPPIETSGVIRQACWVGFYGGIITWLQLGRILTPSTGVLIAVGLVVIEALIRMREKSRWAPAGNADDAGASDDSPAEIEEFHPPEDHPK